MRVTYGREMRVKQYLDEIGVECFLPMRYEVIEKPGDRHRILVPAVHNLIFIHATKRRIYSLKQFGYAAEMLRYMVSRPLPQSGGKSRIMTVPDAQMENFIRVTSVEDGDVIYLSPEDNTGAPGARVKVIDGVFAGVEGVIKRVQKNKRVVVELKGITSVAIAFVPGKYLQVLEG